MTKLSIIFPFKYKVNITNIDKHFRRYLYFLCMYVYFQLLHMYIYYDFEIVERHMEFISLELIANQSIQRQIAIYKDT